MFVHEARSMDCPIMSKPVMIPNDRTGSAVATHITCNANRCPLWVVIDAQQGRCGLISLTDAEAMAMRLGGAI